LISDFLQEIAARALPFEPPPSKSKSLWLAIRLVLYFAYGCSRSLLMSGGRP
jgi:hypothetical protein